MDRYGPSMRSTDMPSGFFSSIGWALCAIGALNWGLVGLMNFNLVHFLFGRNSSLERGVYIAVGLSGFMSLMALLGFIKVTPQVREAPAKLRRVA